MTTTPKSTRAKKPAAEPTPSELLAAEAQETAMPDGAPEMTPPLMLDRRRKAALYRSFDAILIRHRDVTDGGDDTEGSSVLDRAADLFELAADCEDLVLSAAVNADAAKKWTTSASEADVIQVAVSYIKDMQPGEAERSPS